MRSCTLGNIIIFFHTADEPIDYDRQVLTLLFGEGKTSRLKECELLPGQNFLLGHVVGSLGFEVSTQPTDEINGLEHSTYVTELPIFLVDATCPARLRQIIFVWPPFCWERFVRVKCKHSTLRRTEKVRAYRLEPLEAKLGEALELVLQCSQENYTVDTDKYNERNCCVLLRTIDRTYKPIWFWYHQLDHAKQAYYTAHLECFAVPRAVLLLQSYLKCFRITTSRAHHAVQWILILTDFSDKLTSWRYQLSVVNFKFVHHYEI